MIIAGTGVSRSSNTCITFGFAVISSISKPTYVAQCTYMRVVSHESELSPYVNEPFGVRFVPPPLVPTRWRVKYLGGENLPISRLDDLVNSTKCSLSNLFDTALSSTSSLARPLPEGSPTCAGH